MSRFYETVKKKLDKNLNGEKVLKGMSEKDCDYFKNYVCDRAEEDKCSEVYVKGDNISFYHKDEEKEYSPKLKNIKLGDKEWSFVYDE